MNSTSANPSSLHPDTVLVGAARSLPEIPAVDHYAGSEKLMRKALSIQAQMGTIFDVTFDCEDGAIPGAEHGHAAMVGELIAGAESTNRVGARIHGVAHPASLNDLRTIVSTGRDKLAYITLPKIRDVTDVHLISTVLTQLEAEFNLPRSIPLHALVETHGALRDVWQIAQMPRVESLDFGLMDFVSDHHGAIPAAAMKSPGQFEHPLIVRAKCETVAAALAHGIIPTHNVAIELKDMEQVGRDAQHANKQFGFLRMWSIHPAQIAPILLAMRPDFSEVGEACDILCAGQDAAWGPIRINGDLHDRGSYRYFWALLKRARATGMTVPETVEKRFFSKPSIHK